MKERSLIGWLITSVVLSLFLNVLIGRWVAVRVSTLPLLNRLKLLSPQAPIVINTREQAQGGSYGDFRPAINSASPKLSLLLNFNNSQMSVLGGAVNMTSDGLFVTTKNVLGSQKPGTLWVKLYDGTKGKVTTAVVDPGSDLVILKTGLTGVPVAELGAKEDLQAGQLVALIQPDLADFENSVSQTFISDAPKISLAEKDSDFFGPSFQLQNLVSQQAGQGAINSQGQVIGIWDGAKVIPADQIKITLNNFFNNSGQIIRPGFGFKYRAVGKTESGISGTAEGALVLSVVPGLPAQKAGLMASDLIITVNSKNLDSGASLSDMLQNAKPGDLVVLGVMRNKNELTLNLTASQLK